MTAIIGLWTTFAALPVIRRFGAWIAAAGAVLAALAVLIYAQRGVGRRQERQAQRDAALQNAEKRNEIDRDIAAAGGAADRLRGDWSRD